MHMQVTERGDEITLGTTNPGERKALMDVLGMPHRVDGDVLWCRVRAECWLDTLDGRMFIQLARMEETTDGSAGIQSGRSDGPTVAAD